jgi:hypothetical protein
MERIRPTRDVLVAEQDGTAVLLDLRREVFHGLDEVGTRIWRGLESGVTPSSIAEDLAAEYDAPAAAVRADVARFVDELLDRGLVERR